MAAHHNITGLLTQELLAAGDAVEVTSVSIANIHATDAVLVDLYIEKKLTGKFYIMKGKSIAQGTYLTLDSNMVSFDNTLDGFGLYIKLNASDSAADIILR